MRGGMLPTITEGDKVPPSECSVTPVGVVTSTAGAVFDSAREFSVGSSTGTKHLHNIVRGDLNRGIADTPPSETPASSEQRMVYSFKMR